MTTTPQRSGVGRLSIRVRLSLWYAGSLFLILAVVVGVVRLQLHRTLEREFQRAMQQSGVLVQQFFALEIAEYQEIATTLTHITAEAVFPDRLIAFRDPSGAAFASEITNALARRTVLAAPVRSIVLPLDPLRAPRWTVEIRSSAAEMMQVRRDVDRMLLVGLPLLALVAGIGGWWLTGRTLQPVHAMAGAADAIAHAGGAGRLPILTPHDELGRLGLRFNLLLDQLAAALAQQRRFLADAAHELRTPIARMRSAVDLAHLAPPGPDDRAALEEVRDDLARTSVLLGELLLLARADAGPMETPLSPLYLDDLLLDALGPWRAPAKQKEVSLTTLVVEETPIAGDAVLLDRLVGILVDNAIRYTPAGGAVTVGVQRAGASACLEVTDSGIGMSEDERARAVDRFYRGAAARQLVPDGSGLGLPIAAWICERHGGTLSFHAADAGGTRARVLLPLRASTVPATA